MTLLYYNRINTHTLLHERIFIMDLEQIRKIAGITETQAPKVKQDFDVLTESMRKLAGLPLFEAKDEDEDDEDEDDDTPTRRIAGGFGNLKMPEKAKEKAAEEKAAEKPASKAKDFVGPKKRGKSHNPASKSGILRTWIEEHPGVARKEAYAHALATLGAKSEDNPGGITPAGFSTLYQNARSHHGLNKPKEVKEVKEAWVLMHPSVYNHILHENRELNQFQWVHFLSDNQEPMIFESEAEAEKIAKFLSDFKNQSVIIEHVIFEDSE
jgi:hypothetical protein